MIVFRKKKKQTGRVLRGYVGVTATPKIGDRLLAISSGINHMHVSIGDAAPITKIVVGAGRVTYETKTGTIVQAPYHARIVWEESA